jgi:hypothetical protein
MNILKFVTVSLISALTLVSVSASSNAASIPNTKDKAVKMEHAPIKVGPIVVPPMKVEKAKMNKVIPLITKENDPRYKDKYSYEEESLEEYEYDKKTNPKYEDKNGEESYDTESSDEENVDIYNEDAEDGPVDKDGGHWGWHYDTDDTSAYDKDEEPHYGYHYDDDLHENATKGTAPGYTNSGKKIGHRGHHSHK